MLCTCIQLRILHVWLTHTSESVLQFQVADKIAEGDLVRLIVLTVELIISFCLTATSLSKSVYLAGMVHSTEVIELHQMKLSHRLKHQWYSGTPLHLGH